MATFRAPQNFGKDILVFFVQKANNWKKNYSQYLCICWSFELESSV